LLGIDSL